MILNGIDLPEPLSLALRLQWTLIVGGPPPAADVVRVLEECGNDRMKILHKEISLCEGYDTPMAYCIVSNAYVFMGALYRKQAIVYLERYLQNPSWIPWQEKDRARYIASRWAYLGQAYEGEYLFDKSLAAYDRQRCLNPCLPAAYINIARIMKKKNQLDLAIQFLRTCQKTEYYRNASDSNPFDKVIDEALADMEHKYLHGYVYRPRPTK